jgi:microcystin-dependent protein
MEPFLGMIAIFGFNFTPMGWMPCDGRILQISQYSALFALLGTYYGGNGQTTFGLPNLNGRFPLGCSNAGGSYNVIGAVGGADTVTLTQAQMPLHTHTARASSGLANRRDANGTVWAQEAMGQDAAYSSGTPDVNMSASAITAAGSGQAHPNMPPYLILNYCIAVEGIFPSRQ